MSARTSGTPVADLNFDADIFAAKIEAAKLGRGIDDCIDINRRTLLAGHLTCEAEQIIHERLGAPRLLANFFRDALLFFSPWSHHRLATRNIPGWP